MGRSSRSRTSSAITSPPPSPLRPIARRLARAVGSLRFGPPVACVYNPLVYAREPFERYLDLYGHPPKEAFFVGMNPGPFGMTQTGVPFGEVSLVQNWLGIDGRVRPPEIQHPKRPIQGFECTRKEVSGTRFWGWARDRFGTAEEFFDRFFVWSWCPLTFVGQSGVNLTPDKLRPVDRSRLYPICDRALAEFVAALRPRTLIAIGAVAEAALRRLDVATPIARIPHPSPASPLANRNWSGQVDLALRRAGIVTS
jgi:single-strand selective monofunctional uracil DNA glycosylase